MLSLDEKLSPHFRLRFLVRSHTADKLGIDNTPSLEILRALQRLAENLEVLRVLLGNVPIYISSGYRSLALNRAIGSKDTSAHRDGRAADFDAPDFGSPYQICRAIAASDIAFDQLIYEHTWTHIAFPRLGAVPRRSIITLAPGGKSYLPGIVPRYEEDK